MRKNIAFTCVLVLFASLFISITSVDASTIAIGNFWTAKAPLSFARGNLAAACVDGKIYAIGGTTHQSTGMDATGETVGTNEEYNPETNAWTLKASMPMPMEEFTTAALQNKIYCIGASNVVNHRPVNEVYDPATNSWETKTPLSSMKTGMQASVINEKIYLIGGGTSQTFVYDPTTDNWTTKAPMPHTPSGWPTSCVLNDKIYVISSYLTQIYDPANDSWTTCAPLPVAMTYPVSVVTSGINAPERIYVFYKEAVEEYNPTTDTWTSGANAPPLYPNTDTLDVIVLTDRWQYGIVALNDLIYTIGGSSITYPKSIPYTPAMPGNIVRVAVNYQYTPFGYGTIPPQIYIATPENTVYNQTDVNVTFTVNKVTSWLGYSLDGAARFEVTGNTTLTGLTDGSHNITVYAKDEFGNVGEQTINFTVTTPKPFAVLSNIQVAAVLVGIVVATCGVGLLLFRKRRIHRASL